MSLETRCRLQFRCSDSDTSLKFVAAAAGWLGSFEAEDIPLQPRLMLSLINKQAGKDWVMIDREMKLREVADRPTSSAKAFSIRRGFPC